MATADTSSEPQAAAGRPVAAPIQSERRVLTVLFCDVVNSTSLAEGLDPEDWTEIMTGAYDHLTAPVHRYEGTVAKLMGDGMLAFFGAPVAHEDDPQRAVLAALDIIDSVVSYGRAVKSGRGIDFNVRIGINTGPVVVADMGNLGALDALGDAVNVAARMESAAGPGQILLSGDTYRLVAPLFDIAALGDIELKGKAEPVPAYRVVSLKAHPGPKRGIEGITAPLIGRDMELALLKTVVERVRTGRGQIVSLIGEAGLGKSRLLTELHRYWGEREDYDRWDEMFGVPYDSQRPFGIFQNFARDMFGVQLEDPAEVIHRKVVAGIRARGGNDDAVALCSIAMERVIAARTLHDAKQSFATEVVRNDIYDVMYPGFRESCSTGAAVVVIDDLHWADPASVDLIMHLLALVEEVPILFVCAFRPERQAPAWKVKQKAETDFPHRYTEIQLKPLDSGDTNRLVSELLKIADLPAELRELILRKTDGNPYFVEEIIRTLIDDGIVFRTDDGLRWKATTSVADIAIPDNLQALLMARIDRLDQETKNTLQMASVIGRSFYYSILKKISDSAMAVDKHLSALERVELLREASRMPELEYVFKHELARDAAYATILNRRRREFHKRVGDAMEQLFAGRLEEQAHRLAQHFELAGDPAKAAHYYEMAAESAVHIHANEEGVANFERAIQSARQGGDAGTVTRLEGKLAAVPRPATTSPVLGTSP